MKISIVLEALTGSFITDMDRAGKEAKKRAEEMRKDFASAGKALGIAIGSGVSVAAAALVTWTKQTIETSRQIERLAKIAGTSQTEFQRWAAGARTAGIEQDKLADILKDVQDKVGDFLQTGAGPMADFFKNIAPAVGVTAEQFKNLSGPQALQLYVDSLEKANLSQSEMAFFMEAIASDTTALLPLLRNSGQAMKAYGDEAERLGSVLSDETIESTKELQRITREMDAQWTAFKTNIVSELLPTITELAEKINSPAFQEGFAAMIKGAVEAAAALAGLVVEAGNVARWAGEEFAARSTGPAIDDIVRIEQAMERLRKERDALTTGPGFGQLIGALVNEDGRLEKINAKLEKYAKMLAEAGKAQEQSAATSERRKKELADQADATAKAAAEEAKRTEGIRVQTEHDRIAAEASKKAAEEADAYAQQLAETNRELERWAASLLPEAERALAEYLIRQEELRDEAEAGKITNDQLKRSLELLGQEYAQTAEEIRRKQQAEAAAGDILSQVNQAYAEQLRIAGMTAQQRQVEIASLQAIAQWEAAHGKAIDATTEAMLRQAVAAGESLVQASEQAQFAAEEMARAWEDFAYGLADAVLDGSDGVKDYFKQLLDDLKRELIASGLMSIFGQIFNVSGTGRAGGSLLGQLVGGASGGGSLLGGALSGSGGSGGLLGGLIGGGLGTGLLASGSIFSGAGLLGGITGSISAGVASIAGGAFMQGVGLLLGPVGLIVGAVAALTQIFGEDQETILRVRSQQFNGDRQARGVAQSDLGSIFVRGESLGDGAAVEIAGRIKDFDNLIAGLLNDDQLAAVRDRLSAVNDTFRDGSATVGEALDARFSAILGELSADVVAFVGTAGELEDRVGRLAEALQIESLVELGTLGDTFGEVAGLIEQYRVGTEEIGATYTRLIAGAQMFEAALSIAGIAFDGTRQEMIRFAADITEAAGGLERAQSLWAAYFETFYTADERAAYQLQQARSAAASQLGDIGLNLDQFSGDGAAQAFREMFEAVLPTLSAEAVVEWLEAADALGIVINLSGQAGEAIEGFGESLADLMSGVDDQIAAFAGPQSFADRMAGIVSETDALIERATALGATEQQLASIRELGTLRLTEVLNEQSAAMADYQSLVQGVRDELADAQGLSEFGREMREINRWLAETVTAMNEAARAAGMQGAAEADLAAAHELASIRAAEAIARLQERGRSIVEQLYGTELEQLDEQIRQIEAASGGFASGIVGGMNEVTQATDSAVQAQIGAQQRIRDWLDNLMLGDLGGLRPRDALVEAQALFDRTLASALGGDADAMAALPGLADQMLRLGQQVFASGSQYFDLRDAIRTALEQVAAIPAEDPAMGGGGSGGGGPDPWSSGGGAGGDLAALYAEREELMAEQAAAERLALAQELAGVIRDLVIATGDPLDEIAAELGISMAALVADLGVNLGDLTGETAGRLADIAQAMGVELTELSGSVGVDLGALSDAQSLMNDALEAEIAALPEGQRAALESLLRDVEEAAALGDTAGVERGIADMETAIGDMAPDIRDALAPFFLGIAPADPTTEIGHLSSMDGNLGALLESSNAQTDLLALIAAGLTGLQPGPGLGGPGGPGTGITPPPSFAVGTGYVPADGLAMIHRGEAIFPAPVAEFFRREGIPMGGNNDALVAELREVRKALDEGNADRRRMEQRIQQLEATTARGDADKVRAMERQTDQMRNR